MTRRFLQRSVLLLVAVAALPALSRAQVEFEFSGYVVDLPTYQRMPDIARFFASAPGTWYDRDMAMNLMRLRLRPTVRLWEGASFSLEHEVDFTAATQNLLFGAVPDMTNRQLFDLRWHPVEKEHVWMQHYVDRLYFRQNLNWGSIIAGRQRISWGTGRIWNPTDLFNPINPASFDKIEKDGADAISVKYYIGSFTDLHLVYNPRRARLQADGAPDAPDSSNFGARFRTNVEEFDLSLMGGWFDRRVTVGGDFAGNLFDAGVRGEVVHVLDDNESEESGYTRFILGVDYQLTGRLYGVVEYLHNGEGQSDAGRYDVARLFLGEILNVGRDYLYIGGNYLLHPLVNGSFGATANLGDGSGFVMAAATWSSSDDTSLSAGALLPFGASLDEYWYYPSSLYLKGELYF